MWSAFEVGIVEWSAEKNIFDGKPWPMTFIEDVVLFLKEFCVNIIELK